MDTSKKVFLSLPREEALGSLFEWYQTLGNDRAKDLSEHIAIRDEQIRLSGEIAGISRRRDNTLTTSQRFNAILDKRYAAWIWYRDKILAPSLSYLQTLIFGWIIYSLAQWIVSGKP